MTSSLSSLVDNLPEGIHNIKSKYKHNDKKHETCGITYVCYSLYVYYCFIKYKTFKDDLTEYKCLCCNKNYQQKFDEKLMELFLNTHKYFDHDINYYCKEVYILIHIWMIWKN